MARDIATVRNYPNCARLTISRSKLQIVCTRFTFFDFLDFLTSNIMLPITGLLIAIFVGYVMSPKIINEQIGFKSSIKSIWMFLLKFIAPCAVSVVFVAGIIDKFSNG